MSSPAPERPPSSNPTSKLTNQCLQDFYKLWQIFQADVLEQVGAKPCRKVALLEQNWTTLLPQVSSYTNSYTVID